MHEEAALVSGIAVAVIPRGAVLRQVAPAETVLILVEWFDVEPLSDFSAK